MVSLHNHLPRWARRTVIGVVGGIVLVVGIILVPYPGPGWATVFVGLAILSQEFEWAHRVLQYAKQKFKDWEQWVAQQYIAVRIVLFIATGLVVVVTIWLLNGYGLINHWLHLKLDWLNSPFITK